MSNEVAVGVIDSRVRRKSGIGRADLLWALQTLETEQHGSIAAILGFERLIPIDSPDDRVPEAGNNATDDQETNNGSAEPENTPPDETYTPSNATTSSYYRVVSYHKEQTQTAPAADELSLPDWFTQALPTLLEETVTRIPKIHQVKPLDIELVAWSRALPWLQRTLGARIEGRRADTAKLVKQVANVKTIRQIPRQQRQYWAPKARLLIDINDDNFPYRRDFLRLRSRLLQARGSEGLEVQYCYDEPGGYIVRYQQQREIIEPWSKPAPGTAILILSDLGRHAQSRQTLYAWLAFGQMLRAQGFRATVLMPVAERQIDSRLLRFFDCVVWDRSSRLKLVKGDYRVESDNHDHTASIERLMASLFASVRVDSDLLRAVRYCLPGGCDVGHENAVWRHSAVIREGDEWGWQANNKSNYQAQAQQSIAALTPRQQQQLVELIGRHHALYPDELYFETMHGLKILGLKLPDEVDAATDKYLRDMVKTYQAHAEDSLLHAWVKRHLARHEDKTIRQQHDYWVALNAFAIKRDEQHSGVNENEWPSDLSDDERKSALLFINAKQAEQTYQLRQMGEKLVLAPKDRNEPAAQQTWETHAFTGVTLLTLRLTDTHIFYHYRDGKKQQLVSLNLEQSGKRGFQFPATGEHHFHIGSERLTVNVHSAQQRQADWMRFIGSGSRGLYAESVNSKNEVYVWYWHPPEWNAKTGMLPGFWFYLPVSTASLKPDWAIAADRDQYGLYADVAILKITQRFRWIEPTCFMMGSPENEEERYSNETQHPVILTQGYWLADTACTQELWQAVMRNNPSDFKGEQLPVETVGWDDVQNFLKRLNKNQPQLQLRLPTEAEWENACRAGTTTPFSWGEQIDSRYVNFDGNYPYNNGSMSEYRERTVAVKELPCNDWGLYQMHGNVWEWCQDWYGEYPAERVIDPQGSESGASRVLRGGSWIDIGGYCRSAHRDPYDPSARIDSIGFRLARGHELKPSRVLGAGQQPADRSATERAKAQAGDGLRSGKKPKGFMGHIKDLFKGNDEV